MITLLHSLLFPDPLFPVPCKSDRNTRLKECVDIIRALWAGETVTHQGLVTIEEAKLYTRPVINPFNWLKQDIELGFNEIILHNVNREQKQFIEVFGKEVIPVLS